MHHYFTGGANRLRANQVESLSTSRESTQVCSHVSERETPFRTESNRQVPQTNRL